MASPTSKPNAERMRQRNFRRSSIIAASPPTAPEHSLAKLGLGRAYVMSGDTAKAKAAYQDFLAFWKDADPDVPILKEAKAEYAKLQ